MYASAPPSCSTQRFVCRHGNHDGVRSDGDPVHGQQIRDGLPCCSPRSLLRVRKNGNSCLESELLAEAFVGQVIKLMEAFGRLLLAGREFSRLAAYTQRVTQLCTAIDDRNQTTAVKSITASDLGITMQSNIARLTFARFRTTNHGLGCD